MRQATIFITFKLLRRNHFTQLVRAKSLKTILVVNIVKMKQTYNFDDIIFLNRLLTTIPRCCRINFSETPETDRVPDFPPAFFQICDNESGRKWIRQYVSIRRSSGFEFDFRFEVTVPVQVKGDLIVDQLADTVVWLRVLDQIECINNSKSQIWSSRFHPKAQNSTKLMIKKTKKYYGKIDQLNRPPAFKYSDFTLTKLFSQYT